MHPIEYQSILAVAVEHGLSELRYVLYPKPAGFSVCLDQLLLSDGSGNGRGGSSSNAAVVVHDITIAYRDYRIGSRTVEASILKGTSYPLYEPY